jgi:hypothetical protein
MITRRGAAHAAAPAEEVPASYRGLLRAAEAHPDEFFTIAGEKLAMLLRELDGPRRRPRKLPTTGA